MLAEVDGVSQATISGGQELPAELSEGTTGAEEAEAASPTPAPTATVEPEPTSIPTAEPTVDPARLPDAIIEQSAAFGQPIESATEITPQMMQQMTALGEMATQFLSLLTPDNLRALPPETISYLPPAFLETLDADLRAELDELAAEFGGAGAALAVAEEEGGTETETEIPPIEPLPLPESLIAAAAGAGVTISTTADITPEAMQGLVGFAPELLAELTPEMWRVLEPDALTAALPVASSTLDPQLAAQLIAIVRAANGQEAEPGVLSEPWVAAGASVGITLTTTADLTPEVVGAIATTAPELLNSLDEVAILALPSDVLAALPPEYLATLDPGLQQTVQVMVIRRLQFAAAAGEGAAAEAPQVEPVPLPESWVAAGASFGQPISTTADITPEAIQGVLGLAPELLTDLTPEMWRRIDPLVLEAALPAVAETLDPALVAQLTAIVQAANGEPPAPVPLPEAWIASASAAGSPAESTADLPPEAIAAAAAAAPELLAALTPETILAMTPEQQAALPVEYLATLDEGLQETLAVIAIHHARFLAAQTEEVAEVEEPEPTPTAEPEPEVDPARLPDLVIQGSAAAGQSLEFAQDITPEIMRLLAGIPQAQQFLGLLTDDNLRLLPPESIALLPPDFVAGLDAELRAELDDLAAEFGGAGALAQQEAEEAEEAAAGAPALSGPWIQPGPDGSEPLFTTAADLLHNDFGFSAAELLNFLPNTPQVENAADYMAALTPEVLGYLAEGEEGFAETLSPAILEMMSPESITFLLDNFPQAFDDERAERLRLIAAGEVEAFVPEASITRTNGDPSVILNVYKEGDANTVEVAHAIFAAMDEFTAAQSANGAEVNVAMVFEQATFIEDSIEGVSREGLLGALFAVLVILLFLSGRNREGKYRPAWRSTIVIAVSIPLSVLAAFALMRWIPPTLGVWLHDLASSADSGLLDFLVRLFPESVTLNIMTLSGLTVAVGRIVDDSIVVLENIYRFIQQGDEPKEAVTEATKEVAIAIFSSTATTIAVFLPLGLIGGLIGSFFLPFGLTVTYALAASFVVAITVVPALAFLLIRKENLPVESESWMQRAYTPTLKWSLKHRAVTMFLAVLLFVGSLYLLTLLPTSFIPALGEPTVNVVINLPAGASMIETNAAVEEFEASLQELEGIETVQAEVGGAGGFEALFSGGGISQNQANLTITPVEVEGVDVLTREVRQRAEEAFGADNVTVSAASQTGFGGFSLVVTSDSLEELMAVAGDVKQALAEVDIDGDGIQDITNISSSVDNAAVGGDGTLMRIDGRPAIRFSGELETENTLGVTGAAKKAIVALETLPAGTQVTEGFESEQQVQGFQNMIVAIGWSIVLVYIILALTFRSLIHPFTILFSLPFALVGAALALYITDSVLGISAMIGLMMLVGIVVTNAIVLMELLLQLRRSGMGVNEALVQAGRTRLRPIWMTALTAVLALIPLAASRESGAVIASELARVVIGGLLMSTALTLVVVPVVYSLLEQLRGRFARKTNA